MTHLKARFWWALRNWWHYPQFWHQASKPSPIFRSHIYWLIVRYPVRSMPRKLRYRTLTRFVVGDFKMFLHWAYWELRYLQPFRCNGDKGGWRTKVCDWLEEKARREEDIEDNR